VPSCWNIKKKLIIDKRIKIKNKNHLSLYGYWQENNTFNFKLDLPNRTVVSIKIFHAYREKDSTNTAT
jgi:hypothetical protein